MKNDSYYMDLYYDLREEFNEQSRENKDLKAEVERLTSRLNDLLLASRSLTTNTEKHFTN
jgi:predicted nuclease with TOPRIM domain